MKIKLPFTEKFLWDIWKLIEAKDKLMDSVLSNKWHGIKDPFEMIWPDFYKVKDIYWEQYKDKKKRERFTNFLYKLQKNGCLKKLTVKDKTAIMLTPKGIERVFTINLKTIDKKLRNDRKWHMVLFDIPENKRKERDLFRKSLQYLGYKKLQKSIWVCPYDVQKETKELIKRFNLKEFTELLLVKKIGLG
ncbi:MAG: CRISPR-associated endonuclease Cas2 [Candidatus Portnoybacteria bacterium CG10_big_fil_rev_8_21_14_0_10_38_18]|uniref:CRISPR-associated endonuclease Cas2 n=1 Tax=Candidatus Portnoybacteria bacterium CG10_big_fil_rev_8_21_14_0_10_38_18 TaxID=1974813 RepID=A0A2M8KD16_9BACT|nr:MAG: CRISPR-associated endonuclease Cas2 [Candidatus Portnoybacteria bacterium CG10_big_fil_rev_8_21_14_0_10_38_18]